METLTKRQKEILDFLTEFLEQHGYAPSLEEIAAHFHLSSASTVHKHLLNLEQKGFIRRQSSKSRAVLLSEPVGTSSADAVDLPLVGRIAAGQPIEAVLDDETIAVAADMVRGKRTFALEVKGNSMIDESIQDGDYIIVEQTDTANDGDIVVALLDDARATLKRFYREQDHIRLEPANADVEPIIVRDQPFKIQGVATGLLRRYL